MALRAIAAIAVLTIGIAAVAYAATSPRRGGVGRDPARPPAAASELLSAPRITARPAAVEASSTAEFQFTAATRRPRFQCRLDNGGWISCRSPTTYRDIATGSHVFRVRLRVGSRPTSRWRRASWLRVEPARFTITPLFSGLERLYPGAAPVQLPLQLDNPNPIAIEVTELRVEVTRDPAGCDTATNLELVPAGVSGAAPLELPAGGSASVPSPGIAAPTIQLLNLPFNQDACKDVQFPLSFSGEAHG